MILTNHSITPKSWEKALAHRESMRFWLRIYHPSIQRYLFIITYGESGSEKLMEELNSMEGIEIRGENMGSLFSLFRSYDEIRKSKKHMSVKSIKPNHPWFGIDDVQPEYYAAKLCSVFVNEILRPSSSTAVAGFKEIRFLNHPPQLLDEYVKFLFHFFPGCHIIFHRRNLLDVIQSGWMKEMNHETLLPALQRLDKWMLDCHYKYPEQTHLSHFNERRLPKFLN